MIRLRYRVRRRLILAGLPAAAVLIAAAGLLALYHSRAREALPMVSVTLGAVCVVAALVLAKRHGLAGRPRRAAEEVDAGAATRRGRATPPPGSVPPGQALEPWPEPAPNPPGLMPLVVGSTAQVRCVRLLLPPVVATGARRYSSFFSGCVPDTGWEVRGASLRGFSHAESRTMGQDSVGVRWSNRRQSLLLAVADGLGSKRHSDRASTWAVELALSLADTGPTRGVTLADHVATIAEEIGGRLDEENLSGATTLIIAELSMMERRAHLRLATVGDSEVWQLSGGQWQALYHCRTGGGTKALPRCEKATYKEGPLPADAVLVLATDGFATALGSGRSPLAVHLAARWAAPPAEVSFVNDVAFQDEEYLDDRTALAVWTGDAWR